MNDEIIRLRRAAEDAFARLVAERGRARALEEARGFNSDVNAFRLDAVAGEMVFPRWWASAEGTGEQRFSLEVLRPRPEPPAESLQGGAGDGGGLGAWRRAKRRLWWAIARTELLAAEDMKVAAGGDDADLNALAELHARCGLHGPSGAIARKSWEDRAFELQPRLLEELRLLRAVAKDMALDGKDVAATARYRKALEEVATECRRVGPEAGFA